MHVYTYIHIYIYIYIYIHLYIGWHDAPGVAANLGVLSEAPQGNERGAMVSKSPSAC